MATNRKVNWLTANLLSMSWSTFLGQPHPGTLLTTVDVAGLGLDVDSVQLLLRDVGKSRFQLF